MKTNAHARKVLKLRYGAGLLAILLLVSAEFWMVCRLGQRCGQITTQPTVPAPAISDLFAAR
jgi:flagellar biogenesis protein FliO